MAQGERDQQAVHARPARKDHCEGIERPQYCRRDTHFESKQFACQGEDQPYAGDPEADRQSAQTRLAHPEQSAKPMQ